MSRLSNAQHVVEIITEEYESLTATGTSRSAALDLMAAVHGCDRAKLAAIINDYDAGLHGTSGDTTYGVRSTPAHGGYPGALPSTLQCPDYPPADL